MAKKSYIGIDGKARKIKKWYIGVDSKARKVKKAYIGVGGVARPFMSSELTYYGLATNLSKPKDGASGASVGNYALFAGGCSGSTSLSGLLKTVETYNTSLVKSTATNMTIAATSQIGVSTGTNAVFIGGYYATGSPSGGTVSEPMTAFYSYNSSLVMSAHSTDRNGYEIDGATSINGYLIYGRRHNATTWCLNSSFVSVTISGGYSASQGGRNITHSSTHALITGGAVNLTTGCAYSTTLVKTSFTLASSMASHMGTPLGTGAIIGCGDDNGSSTTDKTYNYISNSLVVSLIGEYNAYHSHGSCGTLEDYAVFACDHTYGYDYDSSIVDVFDTNLVHSEMHLSTGGVKVGGRYNSGCATVGSYLLIAGGWLRNSPSSGSSHINTVEVFAV